ncbi:TetR family transcriptional regulator [Paeniglutamicibacter psychrophenolicus]|uniref:AcrR family transcriptional regulator n=1 Tax=Paeniglutamicibacter psychrophenolicus TaxID=257454 RepID=A0ABS4WJ27_9MICC|nr:TetR/AcrR family transcriptional regulator [Paeniglutamicibacter psychrophenolicus]MBP2375968.1 AcrR family transcriptional regulator [Paeniglutamicibacter psychrophenolicus]
MDNSANNVPAEPATPPSLSARMLKTRLSISRNARELTAEHGFAGFTVEELCARVGISRRTFFNYYATKLDAVFGHAEDGVSAEALERFMNARPAGTTGISPTLLADLVALVLEQLRLDDAEIRGVHGFFTILHREPELLARMMKVGPERQAEFTALVAKREGVAADHSGIGMLVHVLQFATHRAIERYLASPEGPSLEEEFLSVMNQTRELFGQHLQHEARPPAS